MALVTDIFNQNAWGQIEFQEEVVERVDYVPQLLGTLNLFTPKPSRSRTIAIATKDRTVSLIPTSATGAPPDELIPEGAKVRPFNTNRLAKGSTVYAIELAGVLALPFDQQTREVAQEISNRTAEIKQDLEYTWEYHRFGAIQGRVMDSDGVTVLWDWYSEWGIAEPAEINFALNVATTDVRQKCREVKRKMMVAGKGVWTPATRVGALVGDTFYDLLVNHPQIKETKLGTERAVLLENIEGYSAIEIEGVTFINYQSSDDGRLAIATDKARFFPIGARNAFQVGWGPANEFKPYLNQAGRDHVALLLADPSGRDAWDRVELYSYPLFIATRPEMLLRGKSS